tara:strand:+ start:14235 stop:15056 length:822 start_codon:yes stop_codon:yes gene_type:complete
MNLPDRMKYYEKLYDPGLLPRVPIVIRLDGCRFSKWTWGNKLSRPYDEGMARLMIAVTKSLVEKFRPVVGYTVSDEITLILPERDRPDMLYGGRVSKLVSTTASHATLVFNSLMGEYLPDSDPDKLKRPAEFDSRAFTVPSREEAVNTLLWRENDGTRNSVAMAAQSVYSHRQLHGKDRRAMMDMLMEQGINWNDYPAFFKRGTYVQSRTITRPPTDEEIARSRGNLLPEDTVTRSRIVELEMPPLRQVTNRVGVIFNKETPQTSKEDESNES